MRYGSVCSGIEAASVAWYPLGWTAAWLSEIEAFPCAVLAHHFPSVPNLGDMTKIAGLVEAGFLEAPDILVGGTPCQAFSVAGLRGGLSDGRGALTLEYVRILDAIDSARSDSGDEPAICCWENVPGVLSSKDNAFGCFLAALAGENDELVPAGGKWTDAGCVYGPQRAVAWRVLDAQYFGLAQRRRRVFVIASARAGFDPAAVLFECNGVRRDTPPSRQSGQDIAAGTLRSTDGGSDVDHARAGHLQPVTCMAHGQGGAEIAENRSPTLTCNHEAPIVVHGTQDPNIRYDQAHALGRNSGQENAVLSVALRGREGGATAELGDEVAGCLRASTGGGDKAHVLAPTTFAIQAGALRTNPLSGPDGVGVQADHAYTLEARAEVQAVAITQYGETAGTLTARHDSNPCSDRGMNVVAYDFLGTPATEVAKETDVHTPLRARKPGQFENSTVTVIQQQSSAVRRLTPRECERLQGFPDGHTMIPWRNKAADDCADGPRYKAIGNSKAVPVVRWIGRRIEDYLNGLFDDDPLI